MVGWFYLLLFSMAPPPSKAHVVLTSMGKYFLVPGPSQNQMEKRMGSMMEFHLSTYSPEEFKVTVTVPMNPNKEPVVLTLNKTRVAEHKVEISSLIEVDIGLMPSFFFEAPKHFGLSVLFVNPNMLVSAAYLAVPISAWGCLYYVATAAMSPYIQVLSARMYNKIEVELSMGSDHLVFVYKHVTYRSGQVLMVTLNRYEAFSISNCSAQMNNRSGSMTGTSIMGKKPLGVIIGNCYSKQMPLGKSCDMDNLPADMSAEMLLITETSATEYVYPTLPDRLNPSLLSIASVNNKTKVIFVNDNLEAKLFPRQGFVVEMPIDILEVNATMEVKGNFLIRGNEDILVLYSQTSGCPDNASDSLVTTPTVGIILPVALFSYAFVWKTPKANMRHYVLIIIASNHTDDLMYDSKQFQTAFTTDVIWSSVNDSMLKVIGVVTTEGDHWLETSTMMKFAAYLYGFGMNTSYMYAAGFHGCPMPMDMPMNMESSNVTMMGSNKTMDNNVTMASNKTEQEPAAILPYECFDHEKMTTAEVFTTLGMLPTNNTGETVVDVITTFRLPSVTPTDAYFNTDPTFGTDTSSEKPETVPPTVDREPEGSYAIYAIVLLLLIPLGLLIYMSVRRQKVTEDAQPPTPDVDVGPAPSVEMPFVVVPDETHVAIDVYTPVEVVRVRRLSGWGTSVDPASPPKIRKVSTGSVTSKKSTRSNKSNKSGGSAGNN